MRIYRMTATFGKLRHEELTLEPGLNIITAPNEWGKSTWCAFLAAMLYGLDTRAKSTKTALADKDRYAPWSGEPMSGRIDLNWNGRDITIERTTKQRVPLGEFRAYETATGAEVPELTAANCGQALLGVEQSVFRRAGFIRLSDLPVTQDENLRSRLNALVSTGDDSGRAEKLEGQLRELKNRCRYNRTGLLPQAEAERENLEKQIAELNALEAKSAETAGKLEQIQSWLGQLYNHQQALAYKAAQENQARLTQARAVKEKTARRLRECQSACAGLPAAEECTRHLRELRSFREDWNAILREQQAMPGKPQAPALPEPFTGMTAEECDTMIRRDEQRLEEASGSKLQTVLIVMGVIGLLAGAGLWLLEAKIFAAIAAVTGLAALVWGAWDLSISRRQRTELQKKYGGASPEHWADPVAEYAQAAERYEAALKEYSDASGDLEVRMMVLRNRREALCGSQEPEKLIDQWQASVTSWEAHAAAQREDTLAGEHVQSLTNLQKPAPKPTKADTLTQSEAETSKLLSECAVEQQRLQNRLGQYQGRMAALGNREALQKALVQEKSRIARLEETYEALTIALDTLAQAKAELQRRFAPRITRRAQELLGRMTGGRYSSLRMREDFSLEAQAEGEDTLRSILCRSDGTTDQLYLAVRLAVAEELTPEAPLVLDDALARFDDERLCSAVALLRELGERKQILLFTCQSREQSAQ